MEDRTIKELADQLQGKIDIHMESFMQYHSILKEMTLEGERLEKKMVIIMTELEPVESLIYNQNPSVKRIFESLKRVYGKDEDGINREIS